MDSLIKIVAAKAGISEEAARMAIEAVLGFLKQKLPAQVYFQLENVITGGITKDLSNSIGGMLKK